MTFASRERSGEGGDPFQLFRFIYTPGGDSYNYTNLAMAPGETINEPYENQDYQSISIEGDKVRANGTLDQSSSTIRVPAKSDLAQLFLVWPPSHTVLLRIRQGHVGDTEYPVGWIGRVISCRFEGNEAYLQCEPVSTALFRPGLRRRWSIGCPYILYDEDTCKADEVSATSNTTVDGIASTTLTVPSGWNGGNAAAKYNGGKVTWDNSGVTEIRTILAATNATIRLNGLIRGLAVSDTITVTLGCNQQESDCVNLHNNLPNFGGQSFLPTKNPFGDESLFY